MVSYYVTSSCQCFYLFQAASLVSGGTAIPAQFILLSAYIELASGELRIGRESLSLSLSPSLIMYAYIVSDIADVCNNMAALILVLVTGHTSLALEIVKKRHLFPFGGGEKKPSQKMKLSRQ